MDINSPNLADLRRTYSAAYRGAYTIAESVVDQVATLIPSTGEANVYPWFGEMPGFREWLGDRFVNKLSAHKYTLVNKDFEVTVAVDRNAILDNTFETSIPRMQQMGYAAKLHPDLLVFNLLKAGATELCFDGQPFFNASHPVIVAGAATTSSNYDATGAGALWVLMDTRQPLKPLIYQKRQEYKFTSLVNDTDPNVFWRKEYIYGADGRSAPGFGLWQMAYGSLNTLNAANVEAYYALMMALKSDEGFPLNIRPNLCVVGPSNWAAARAVFETPTLAGGAANPNYGLAKVLIAPYLV